MEYNSTGGMKSPFSPRVRQSISGRRPIGLGSAKKNQSKFLQSAEQQSGEIVYKTPYTSLETYGTPLPVIVTETLAFASGEVSVRLSPCGWCWVVCGRRVLAWPWEPALPPAAARELALPQTDLAHKADLVVLFYEEGAQMPSCVGVSPEGVVRYWSSLGAEGAYCDVSCELAGQECDRLTEARDGLLLATTTCTLVRITTSKEGRPSVSCATLRPPSGWLGGLGRRVSLLFFGSMPAHQDTKLVNVVVLHSPSTDESQLEEEECLALVAGGPLLQLWVGSDVRELPLRRPLGDALARAHLAPPGDLNTLEIVALDAHAHSSGGLLLLLQLSTVPPLPAPPAAPSPPRAPDARYALAHVSVEQRERVRVVSLCPLRARADAAPRCLPLPRPLLYTPAALVCVAPSSKEQTDVIDVSCEADALLGAAQCSGRALLFSRRHGVLLLRGADPALHHSLSLCESPMGSPCPSDMYDGNLSLYEIDPDEVSAMSTDATGKLKSAFLYHVRGQHAPAARLLGELFPRPDTAPDAPLDRTVLAVAADLLDDAPAGDPRWKLLGGPATRVALGSSAALQAAAQLQDKHRAFSLFLDFLRAHGLWRRLGTVTRDNAEGISGTQHELGGLLERLSAARALQRLHRGGAPLVDAALHHAAAALERGGEGPGGEEPGVLDALRAGTLSAPDVCFRRVTRVLRVLEALCVLPAPPHDARAAAAHAHHALVAVNAVVGAMHASRSQWEASPPCAPPSLAPHALLPSLCSLHTRAVTECAHKCPDAALRAQVLEEAGSLARAVLLEAAPLDAPRTAHLYEKIRTDTIQPYIAEGQFERAAVLAEKFKDFDLLIQMCVDRNDTERLYEYIDKYENEGFPEKAFAWLASRGGASCALLVRSLGPRAGSRLSRWLAAAPARRPLLALHRLSAGDTERAAELFADIADEEDTYVNRMATASSLSKLCALSGRAPPRVLSRAARCAALARQHRALPAVLRHDDTHTDAHEPPLRSADDLVQMYIEADGRSLTEYDYKKALDLTELVDDNEKRDDLRLKIWSACISRDDWSNCRVDAPDQEMQDKMFFRLLDLVHLMGGDLEQLLPPLEELLSARAPADELLSARAPADELDQRALYVLHYGYQCATHRHDA